MPSDSEHSIRRCLNRMTAECLAAQAATDKFKPDQIAAQHPQLAAALRVFAQQREPGETKGNDQPTLHGLSDIADAAADHRAKQGPGGRPPSRGSDENTLAHVSATIKTVRPQHRFFGDYELLAEIAHGGMGVVYKARQLTLNRTVALKMILAGQMAREEDVKRLQLEAAAAGKLDHPGIVPIFEIGEHEGQHYFTMGYIDGPSLAEQLQSGPMSPRRAVEIILEVCEAVQYAHQQGIIHRDLKPANVLIDSKGHPRVTDFGLAKSIECDSELTRTGQVLGTPSYMPPEQAAGQLGKVGPTSDVYALGAVLYTLLSGRPPFQAASTVQTLMQVLEQEPVSLQQFVPSVPLDLNIICLKCLEKDRSRRYSSAAELADDLRRWHDGEPIHARPISFGARLWRWCQRNPVVATLSALVLSLLAGLGISGPIVAYRQASLRHSADTARSQAEESLLDMYSAMGFIATRQHEPETAMLWFANAVARTSDRHGERRQLNRIRVNSWMSQSHLPVNALLTGESQITQMAFHPQGSHLLTHTTAGCQLWDLNTERRVELLPDAAPAIAVLAQWNHAGTKLAVVAVGALHVRSFPEQQSLARSVVGFSVRAMATSRDGRYLALGGARLRIWDWERNDFVGEAFKLASPAVALVYDTPGNHLLVFGHDHTATVFQFDGQSRQFAQILAPVEHNGRREPDWLGADVVAPQWLGDRHGLITCKSDGILIQRDSRTGRKIRQLTYASSTASALVADREGRFVVVGGFPYATLITFDGDKTESYQLEHSNNVVAISISSDGSTILTGSADRTARLWSAQDGSPLGHPITHTNNVHAVAFSRDGLQFATAQEGGLIRVWSRPEGRRLSRHFPTPAAYSLCAMSPDGKLVIPCGATYRGAKVNRTYVHEIRSGRTVGHPIEPGGYILAADFSPNGREVAVCSSAYTSTGARLRGMFLPDGKGGNLTVWNWNESHMPVATVAMPSEPRDVDYSPDGKLIAVVCATSEVVLVDTEDWSVHRRIQLGSTRIMHNRYRNNGRVRFSPDGHQIIVWGIGGDSRRAGGTDNQVYLYEVPSGKLRYVLKTKGRCCDVQFSPDGTRMVTASFQNEVRVWELATGQPLAAAIQHPDWVFTAKFSPDGQYLVSAGRDSFARVWHWQTGRLVSNPMQHDNEVMDVAFLNDGQWVATASHDSSIRIWHAATGRPLSPPLRLPGMAWQLQVTPDERHIVVGGKLNGVFSFDLQHVQPLTELMPDHGVMLAELASGKRLIGDGGITNLTVNQYMEQWQAFRQAQPSFWTSRFDPTTQADWHRRSMQALYTQERWAAALWHANRLVEDGSVCPSDFRHRAQIHQKLGNRDLAIADYTQLVESEAEAVEGLKRRAALYMQTRSWDRVIKDYQELIKLAPNDPRAHVTLGMALELDGRADESIAAIRKSIEIDPQDVLTRISLASLLARRGDTTDAIAELRKALDVDPRSGRTYLELVRLHIRSNDYEQAALTCTQALQIKLAASVRVQIQFLHGTVMEQLGQFEKALASKEKAYALGARHPAYKENPEQWLELARRKVELNAQLADVLDGSLLPANDTEKIEYAGLCYYRKLYSEHVRLAKEAFQASPRLAKDPSTPHRYNAACSAALASGGGGTGKHLDDAQRAASCEQAYQWLQQELDMIDEQLERGPVAQRSVLATTLRHWQRAPDLAAIRDTPWIERLPKARRSSLEILWNKVETICVAAESTPARMSLKEK